MSNSITGTGTLTKAGNGTLTLNGLNADTGPTVVNGGTLAVVGTYSGLLTNAPGTTLLRAGHETRRAAGGERIVSARWFQCHRFVQKRRRRRFATHEHRVSPATSGASSGTGNDFLEVSGHLTLNNNTLFVNPQVLARLGVPYPIIHYSGSRSGSFNPAVAFAAASRPTPR